MDHPPTDPPAFPFEPVSIGCVGLGGYAGGVCDWLIRLRQEGPEAGPPPLKIEAACDPDPSRFPQRVAALASLGIPVRTDLADVLAQPIESVWLPVPIHLHRPFTESALAAGKSVLVEKPLAGCLQDALAIRAARDHAGLPCLVGFQDMYRPELLQLKRIILAGELGAIQRASVLGHLPRGDVYYARNDWAGKLRLGEDWILDSPANNAMAHPVNLALYLLGPSEADSADPMAVNAELYRARSDIENFDTVSARVKVAGGASLEVHMTHACFDSGGHVLVQGEKGSIQYGPGAQAVVRLGNDERVIPLASQPRHRVVYGFGMTVRGGEPSDQPVASLENALAHAKLISGISAAAPVRPIPPEAIERRQLHNGDTVSAIRGIEQALQSCHETGRTLAEAGGFDWAAPGGRLDLTGIEAFTGPPASAG